MQVAALYVAVLVLLAVIYVLVFLLIEQSKSIRHSNDLHHRDRVDSRARFLEALRASHAEYRALVESYVRQEGKVYVTPIVRTDDDAKADRPTNPDPPKHAFRMKPVPPKYAGAPSISTSSPKE